MSSICSLVRELDTVLDAIRRKKTSFLSPNVAQAMMSKRGRIRGASDVYEVYVTGH
jgi:hypothetical protein